MDFVREYLISIVAISLISAVIMELLQTSAIKRTIKMICGTILAITVIGPLRRIDLTVPEIWTATVQEKTDAALREGQVLSQEAFHAVIKQKTETYILDKAAELDAMISVSVELDDGSPPQPKRAFLSGHIPLQVKQQLEEILHTHLGIAKENLEWTGQSS